VWSEALSIRPGYFFGRSLWGRRGVQYGFDDVLDLLFRPFLEEISRTV
jgi:hypothetical protein